jgi:hypothetical protein
MRIFYNIQDKLFRLANTIHPLECNSRSDKNNSFLARNIIECAYYSSCYVFDRMDYTL